MADLLRLIHLMRPWAGWIFLGVLASLMTLLANVTLMAVSGWFIASMALAGLAGISMNYFTPAAIIRAMAITRTVGRYVERLITHEATLRLVAHMRRWFYNHLEPLAPARLQSTTSGDLFSRIGADISVLEDFYLRTLVPGSVALIALPLFLIFAGTYSLSLSIGLAILYGLAGLCLPLLIHRFGKTASKQQVLQQATIRSDLVQGLQGMREMLVYGRTDDFVQEIDEQSAKLSQSQIHLAKLQASSQSIITLATNLAILLVLFALIPQIQSGMLSGPLLPMLTFFAMASFEAIIPLPMAMQSLITTRMAASRLFELADQSRHEVLTTDQMQCPIANHPSSLKLEHVTFCYPEQSSPAFKDLSFSLNPGKRLAITGPSGSGKSSLINALVGFWPIENGCILIHGMPHDLMTEEQLRAHFAVASQKPHLFNSTLRGNLLLANEQASPQALEEVCQITQLDGLIASLPKGLDTYLGEAGQSLSGGQIRRLAIARALLSPAPILILDEPGEGLDPQMEQQILGDIFRYAKDKSIILITHSNAGLCHMDEIIKFGTHQR